VIEKRRYARAPIDCPATFSAKGVTGNHHAVAKDVAVGGMFLETQTPASFGVEVIVHVTLPGSDGELALPGVVRWVRDGGMGVQFGLLGAVETHIITEIARKYTEGKR
jgi:type IV pilus assembly protein PilZ